MIYIYYCIIALTIYLVYQSYLNYRYDKTEHEIKDIISHTVFDYKK